MLHQGVNSMKGIISKWDIPGFSFYNTSLSHVLNEPIKLHHKRALQINDTPDNITKNNDIEYRWEKFMKQYQVIKQNWTGWENFEICFGVIFDSYYQIFICGCETSY